MHAAPQDLSALVSAFDAAGFVVQEGKLEYYDVTGMVDAGLVPSCYAYNPSTPYMVYKLPPAPGQSVNNTLTNAPLRPENQGLWIDSRLRQDEVVVLVGETPPYCAYFSYQSYFGLRSFPDGPSWASITRRRVFASLGDSTNNLNVRTADGSPGPFNSSVLVISSGNRHAKAEAYDALQQAGCPDERVNRDVLPQSLVRMGLDADSDTFVWIHRATLFDDPVAGKVHENRTFPVLRLTPKIELPADPLPAPDLKARGSGNFSEIDLVPAVDRLRAAVLARHGTANTTEPATSIWLGEGWDGIQQGVDMLADIRDTAYLRTDPFLLGQDDFAVFYGVNHAATGRATYSNVCVYGTRFLNGLSAVTSRQFGGSVGEYLPGDPAALFLYVWTLARSPLDANTTLVPTTPGALGIRLDDPLFGGFRAYLDPVTGIGPLWTELAYDRVIVFNRTTVGPGPVETSSPVPTATGGGIPVNSRRTLPPWVAD
ncbi:MAG TPA: hypothetical protein HA263_08925 [Methanoregulaceae archaeon]|nr:hypothetical protein [Methanoregulaceae archaeon]